MVSLVSLFFTLSIYFLFDYVLLCSLYFFPSSQDFLVFQIQFLEIDDQNIDVSVFFFLTRTSKTFSFKQSLAAWHMFSFLHMYK